MNLLTLPMSAFAPAQENPWETGPIDWLRWPDGIEVDRANNRWRGVGVPDDDGEGDDE